jgi:hypothetical protein
MTVPVLRASVPEPRLVEQAVLEQGVGKLAEPVLHDVLAGLLLQAADHVSRIVVDDLSHDTILTGIGPGIKIRSDEQS